MTEPTKARDLSVYATKEPTSLHKHYAEWIEAKTGIRPSDKDVQLAVSLYVDFQASPENKARQEKEKAEKIAAREAAKVAKKGGPRSAEARELKKLQGIAEGLKDLDQPVPAKVSKRIKELTDFLQLLPEAQAEVEVPEQKSDDETATEENLQADAINA